MVINATSGLITWIPANEQSEGTHNVNVSVTDSEGAFDMQIYTISVANVNDQPLINSIPTTTATEEMLYTYDVASDDDDFRTLNPTEIHIYSLDLAPSGMLIDSLTGVISWIPTNEQSEGIHNVIVRVSDIKNAFITQFYQLTVVNINDPPIIFSKPTTNITQEQVLFTHDVNADDDDFRTLNPSEVHTYSLDSAPSGMTINPDAGVIEWTPTTEQAFATYDVTIRVTDSENAFDLQSFSIFVEDTTPPAITIISAPSEFINTDGIIVFEVFELHDNNPIVNIAPDTTLVRTDFANNKGTYAATYTDEGFYRVTIMTTDQSDNTNSQTLESFTIDKTAPITTDDINTMEWHTEDVTINLAANDPVSGGVSSGVHETYYIIYQGEVAKPISALSLTNPIIDYEDDDNWIEYWSVDVAGNEEQHKLVKGIKLDKTPPFIQLELDPLLLDYPNNEPLPVLFYVYDPVIDGTPSNGVITNILLDDELVNNVVNLNVTYLLGKHTIKVNSVDIAGNSNNASLAFTVFLQLLEDQMFVTPESLKITPGVMTAHIMFPGLYDASQIFNFTLEGAPYDHADGEQDQQLNVHFERMDVANSIASRNDTLDIQFLLEGWVHYNGQLVKVLGSDEIMKIVDEIDNQNQLNQPPIIKNNKK
jgi:hypothetical protein